MGDSVYRRKVSLSDVIPEATYRAQNDPDTARAWLLSQAFTDFGVVGDDQRQEVDTHDATTSKSGKFAEVGTGHFHGTGELRVQVDQYDKHVRLNRGDILALRVFYDFDDTGVIYPDGAARNLVFVGFVRVGSVNFRHGQRGAIEVSIAFMLTGFHEGDIQG